MPNHASENPFAETFGWFGPFLSACCLAEPGMARMLATAEPARFQLIPLFAAQEGRIHVREAAALLAGAPMRKALERLTGTAVAGARGLLARFGAEMPRTRREANDLLAVLSDETAIASARGLRCLLHGQLRPLVLLPQGRDWCGLMMAVGDCRDTAKAIGVILALASTDQERAACVEAFASVRSRGDLNRFGRSFLESRPIPAPPWPGNLILQPIRTIKELHELGRRNKLCFGEGSHDIECLEGRSVIYRHVESNCFVDLNRVPQGWRVAEMKAPGNREVPRDTASAIEAVLLASVPGLRSITEQKELWETADQYTFLRLTFR